MKKELLLTQQNYIKECEIDERTLPMIVHHYISIGEQTASKLTDERIEQVYNKCVADDQAAQARGAILAITPEFQKYILVACQKLAQLPAEARYNLIKKNL
jgi:hypothetical protein